MASKRGRGTSKTKPGRGQARRRSRVPADDRVPDVFQEMLAEVAAPEDSAGAEERPLKRRRVGKVPERNTTPEPDPLKTNAALSVDKRNQVSIPRPRTPPESSTARQNQELALEPNSASAIAKQKPPSIQDSGSESDGSEYFVPKLQTITDSEESEESGVEWEDVGLFASTEDQDTSLDNDTSVGGISVEIKGGKQREGAYRQQRKGITKAEKAIRIAVHKMHLLCLLAHLQIRNSWCNDKEVQKSLKPLLSSRMFSYLRPNPGFSQFQAARSFMDGLTQVADLWKVNFKIITLGIQRAKWADNVDVLKRFKLSDDFDPPMTLSDFRQAALSREGSADIGAQLLCALLRVAGVETRLVCSLQALPYGPGSGALNPVLSKPEKTTLYIDDLPEEGVEGPPVAATASPIPPPRLRRFGGVGRPGFSSSFRPPPPPPPHPVPKRRRVIEPHYPVFWVEAFNSAHQKWVPVDPIVTRMIGKPTKLEPPLSLAENRLTYVVAFESDGTAKDVTKRYTKSYNAKVRKLRVDSVEEGERWWRRSLGAFQRRRTLDRDQVEDAELARNEAAEGMPRNIQDFKDHPCYALERHLKNNEIIYPKREVGKVAAGTSTSKQESVYRRGDVHVVRSADRWYRLGRDLKPGEQPLKHCLPRRKASRRMDEDAEPETEVGLYALFQTELYVPPPVVRGRVPRNGYGNLDIYVPSMVPTGGVHIRHSDAAKAARILNIDHAGAVTGFQFKGRHGTAIIEGAIVASEYQEAIEAVVDGLDYMRQQAEETKRSVQLLRLWRRFLIALRVHEHIDREYGGGSRNDAQIELDSDVPEDSVEAGGFFRERDSDGAVGPTDGGFFQDEDDTEVAQTSSGGFLREASEVGNAEADTEPGDIGLGSSILAETHFGDNKGIAEPWSKKVTITLNTDYELGGGFFPKGSDEDEGPWSDSKGAMAYQGSSGLIIDEIERSPTPGPSNLHVPSSSKVAEPQQDIQVGFPPQAPAEEMPKPDCMQDIESEASGPAGSDDELDSLPSHDPEDEDAEPEWLDAVIQSD